MTTSADINFGDNDKAVFGAGSDLQIYHDGSNSIIKDAGTGQLQLHADNFKIMNAAGTENIIFAAEDGLARLFYDSSTKLTTTSTGIDVTGAIEADDKITIAYEAGSSDWELESTSGDDFTISRNGSQKLLIDGSTSNVGIATSTPSFKLDVTGTARATLLVGGGQIESSSGFSSDTFRVMGVNTSNQSTKHGGVFVSKHADSNALLVGQHDTALQSLVVKGSGDVLFQKTSATTSGAGTFFEVPTTASTMPVYLRFCKTYSGVREAISFNHSGSYVGGILFDNSSTTYATSSDYRLKENVVTDWDATTRLKQLKPARFNFITDADKTVDGFLAHEVSSIVPEAITGTKDEVEVWEDGEKLPDGVSVGDNKLDDDGNTIPKYQSIDQSKIVPLLVKTIQELEARITALESA
jgi:hypothetical protein